VTPGPQNATRLSGLTIPAQVAAVATQIVAIVPQVATVEPGVAVIPMPHVPTEIAPIDPEVSHVAPDVAAVVPDVTFADRGLGAEYGWNGGAEDEGEEENECASHGALLFEFTPSDPAREGIVKSRPRAHVTPITGRACRPGRV